ncbi:MAG: NYN domain-containing protein [Acidobacteriia bacterium]|nr:NYN domain-containing protein [Terriglobia bacterium]
MGAIPVAPKGANPRIRVFVDYWNLQLTLNDREQQATGQADVRFKIDWRALPLWLAKKAAEKAGIGAYSFEGAIIYTSHDPNTAEGRKFNAWVTTWLNRQPGIQAESRPRQTRNCPKCNVCHRDIRICPHADCGAQIAGTIEKGVDTAIVTDMIRLAWEDAYEVAVLASSDADLVPAVAFLDQKGRKVVQAGFPPSGVHLATACWASFDIFANRNEICRP